MELHTTPTILCLQYCIPVPSSLGSFSSAAAGGDVSSIATTTMSSVVKLGTWGGDGGSACDLTVAPQRLESITIRWGKVIDWISFSYRDRDGKLHTTGRWGGNGKGEGTETMTLEASEYVTGVAWSVGPFTFKNVERCITCIKVVTNLRSFGPFGHGVDSTHHDLPVLNGSVVGMFARAGDFLDAIGFYILPAALPAVKPAVPEQDEKEKDSSQEENQEEKEKDGNQKEEDKSSQEEKEDSSHEEKEEEKSDQEEKEKEKSGQEAKENGKS